MKILSSDLDGTLIRKNIIMDKDLAALKSLNENGHKFIISTGRTLNGVKFIFNDYSINYDYLILCNGSLIIDSNDNIVYKKQIKSNIGKEILKDFCDMDDIYMYFDDGQDSHLIEGCYNKDDLEMNMEEYIPSVLTKKEALEIERDYQIISLFPKDKSIETAENIKCTLTKKYGEELEVFRNQYFLDIVPKGCSKGIGVKKVVEIIEGKFEDLYTIGDSFNDVSMFEVTENSYTFHNAEEKVKAFAKNHVDYVHECIGHMLLK